MPSLECSRALERSSLRAARPFQQLPASGNFICFKRVFSESVEHQRGRVYAAFAPANSMAALFRE
jgi:hypothetical protein